MKKFAFIYAEILKMFPETEEMKQLQIRDKGTDFEFITDPRTITDDFLNSIVYPVTENALWYAYVCPNCGKFHIRGKHIKIGIGSYSEEWFTAPENCITLIQDWKERIEHRNNEIHLKDFDGMTVYNLEMYSAIVRIIQTVWAANDPELTKARDYLLSFGCFDGFQARYSDEYSAEIEE